VARRINWRQKHNTRCVGHHYEKAKTKNGNKTQTTGGKDEPNIVLIRTLQRTHLDNNIPTALAYGVNIVQLIC
jgi:hypothetical protein